MAEGEIDNKDQYSSEYWSVENIEKREQEILAHAEAINQEKEGIELQPRIFYCIKCGFVFDETKQPFRKIEDVFRSKYKQGTCPKCGAKEFKDVITAEKLREKRTEFLKKERQRLRQEEEERLKGLQEDAKEVVKWIDHEMEDLFEDLSDKLELGYITPERFIYLFYNISGTIMTSQKKIYMPDIPAARKKVLLMCESIVDLYDLRQEQMYEIQEITRINHEDKILDVYNAKYKDKRNEEYDLYRQQSKFLCEARKKLNKQKANKEQYTGAKKKAQRFVDDKQYEIKRDNLKDIYRIQ